MENHQQQHYYYQGLNINNNNNVNGSAAVAAAAGVQNLLFPVGYRFCPRDDELIVHYLMKKVHGEELPPNRIHEVEIYEESPNDLAEQFRPTEGDVWFFFTSRTRKYKNGSRPKRAAGDGYWKATGKDKPIENLEGVEVGSKKALVYYKGKPPHGTKTNWIMHEFRVKDPPVIERLPNNDMLDKWVLCQIYHKGERASNDIDNQSTSTIPNQSPLSVDNGISSSGISMNAQDNNNMQIVRAEEEADVQFHATSGEYQSTTADVFVPSINSQSTSQNSYNWQSRAMFNNGEVIDLPNNGHQQIDSCFDVDFQYLLKYYPNEDIDQQSAPGTGVAQQSAPGTGVASEPLVNSDQMVPYADLGPIDHRYYDKINSL